MLQSEWHSVSCNGKLVKFYILKTFYRTRVLNWKERNSFWFENGNWVWRLWDLKSYKNEWCRMNLWYLFYNSTNKYHKLNLSKLPFIPWGYRHIQTSYEKYQRNNLKKKTRICSLLLYLSRELLQERISSFV